jgi:hypothetical protein
MDQLKSKQTPIEQLLCKPVLQSTVDQAALRTLLRINDAVGITYKNIFESADKTNFDHLLNLCDNAVEIQKSLALNGFDARKDAMKFVPIRAFRSDPAKVWSSVDKLRIFLSSGTTSGPDGRSQSFFSPHGLAFYRIGSISAYFSLLESRIRPFFDDFMDMVSISLIPPVEEWPDSSLAQMVAWLGEVWKFEYADSSNSKATQQKLSEFANSNRPIVVLGTAFHFVNLIDEGCSVKLPAGSLIIETGGTKGKSRSVSRQELYDLICRNFAVSENQIVSEYGMCEIATPAWDMIAADHAIELTERRFKFPWWVKCYVDENSLQFNEQGEGCLSIKDPLRIDLAGAAIQTEDLAHIDSARGVKVLGRVPKSPLKGCSLKVEEILGRSAVVKTSSIKSSKTYQPDHESLKARSILAQQWIESLMSDTRSIDALVAELGIKELAAKALGDLKSGLPNEPEGFITAALNACGNKKSINKRWCFIPPSSHSMACIHPLLAALILGLDVRVRLPIIAGVDAQQTFLAHACRRAVEFGFAITMLTPDWRIGPNDLIDAENILVFGDDDTVKFIESFAPGRVSSFGNAISGSAASYADLTHEHTLTKIIDDHFSLGQRGCLSSRFIVCDGGDPDKILAAISKKIPDYVQMRQTTSGIRASVGLEAARLRELGAKVEIIGGHTIVAAAEAPTSSEAVQRLTQLISRLDFVIPVIICHNKISTPLLAKQLKECLPIKLLGVSNLTADELANSKQSSNWPEDIRAISHGNLAIPTFNGFHLGRAFFDY